LRFNVVGLRAVAPLAEAFETFQERLAARIVEIF
jgi:hypothetical protein